MTDCKCCGNETELNKYELCEICYPKCNWIINVIEKSVTNMKKVCCGYDKCCKRRIHWDKPDTMRPQQTVEVPDDFPENKKAYCSIECACMDGAMSVRTKTTDE